MKYVPNIEVNEPMRSTGGMKKSVASIETKDPVHETYGIRKNVPTIEVSEPPEETVVMNKAEIPVEGSSVQHIGGWKGLNKRATFDSGSLSEAVNVSFRDFPNVESIVVPEVASEITFTDKVREESKDEEGNKIIFKDYPERKIEKVYDCVTRGNELFMACDLGYVYGLITTDGFKYIPIGVKHTNFSPTEKTRLVFVETHSTEDTAMTITKKACVFSTCNKPEALGVLPVGSIDFTEDFIKLFWEDNADTDRIYVVCDNNGKATQVWRYMKVYYHCESSSSVNVWCELRRNIFLKSDKKVGYVERDHNMCQEFNDSSYVYNKLVELSQCEGAIDRIDKALLDAGDDKLIKADDNIDGHYFYITESEGGSGSGKHFHMGRGIFDFEKTVSPKFEHVTFYKGRVFGSVGSSVIASCDNSYNKWTLDTTADIGSDNAWMATTTANANADGSIVAMREYLGRISVLKSGFMQEVYGGSNPFTIQDVYAVGTPFPEAVCEAYGRLCFCGKNAIKTYGGSFPRVIGDEIGVDVYKDVHMLGNDRSLVIKSGDEIYKYDFLLGLWAERKSDYFTNVAKMVVLSGEMYAVTNTGELIKFEGESYGAWSFATDAMTENTLSLKRLQKVRLTYELGAESEFSMFVVKSDGREVETVTRRNEDEKTVLQRCEFSITNAVDWFLKLRFTGSGYFKLISMDVEVKNASATAYE